MNNNKENLKSNQVELFALVASWPTVSSYYLSLHTRWVSPRWHLSLSWPNLLSYISVVMVSSSALTNMFWSPKSFISPTSLPSTFPFHIAIKLRKKMNNISFILLINWWYNWKSVTVMYWLTHALDLSH